MSLISISNMFHSFGINEIFEDINFSIEQNSKIGLVGKNGCGKTTLFNIIKQNIVADKGIFHKAKYTNIAYLTQEPELNPEQTLEECVSLSRLDQIELENELTIFENNLSNDEMVLSKYAKLQEKFELMGGYNFKTEMKLVLTNLKFPKSVWNRKIKSFSGGELSRIQLAKILLQPFDLLLLDEPTNHLDLEMIFWLEKYLQNLQKPYLIISHDRYFLDNAITKIAEIRNKSITLFSGNYSFYKIELAARLKLEEKTFKKQQKKIERMEKQIDQYRIWGRARDSEVMFKRAKELEKRLAKIERVEAPKNDKKIKLSFETKNRSGNDVFTLENLTFGFADKILAKDVNLRIFYQNRIALLGKNGCGKTTFLKLLNNELMPLEGTLKKGSSIKIGYYDQMHLKLNNALNVMETIWELVPFETKGYILSFLARFGFVGDDVEKSVSILSGGEKARLYLAKLIHEKPNFLILDEPTNHLDIDMIFYLEKALLAFEGTIIFVSHDRYLIEHIADKKWIFKNNSIVETTEKLENLFFQKEKRKPKKIVDFSIKKNKKTNPLVLQKLLNEIEHQQIEFDEKTEKLAISENKFTDANIYSDENKLKLLTQKVKKIKMNLATLSKTIEILENKYLELL
ncbi:MAG: ABC-F family ATP-binding cassette domain-containing protein [Candidatus Cloacimonetes bacterium]|jgi:ATP-binding cassette, subfamily F, member 3|nr:ABC-F family ATP-binding cassette domain-containing protein [Candidatus Cloacimonadota bacterium]